MKTYKIVEQGRDIYRFISIPRELIDYDLEITIRPIKKSSGSIFEKFLKDKEKAVKYKKFTRKELNER